MNLETKTVHPAEVKFDDEAGSVRAVFATLNVKDSDGDVTLPGFFGDQKVAIAESHDRSKLVGKGRIYESGDTVVMEGKYFLETIQGEQSYLTAKAMGDLQEWSYGFYIEKGGVRNGMHNDEAVRFLTPKEDGTPGAMVAEVSTVLVGAGVGTHTASIKSSQEGSRFVEQAETVAKAAEMLLIRATEIRDMRAEKGKGLGDEAVAKLLTLQERFFAVAEMFGGLAPSEPHPHSKLRLQHMVDQAEATLAESLQLIGR